MPRLPDRFDLWVRRARAFLDPERQLDYVLGALVTLPNWYFFNLGTSQQPVPAVGEVEGARALLVFSDYERASELTETPEKYPPVITIAFPAALDWCVSEKPGSCEALLLNPGEDGALIPLERAAAFAQAWKERDSLISSGFWIPHLSNEEEDFWREHGL